MIIDPCYFRAMGPGMDFGGSTGLAFTMVLGGIIGAHIRLFLTALGSIALPLFIVPTSFCFSFSSIFSTMYLLFLVDPGVSECLELS